MPPSALSQVVEAGPQWGETSAELPYAFRILRPAHVPIISARLTGVNRRAIIAFLSYSAMSLVSDLNRFSVRLGPRMIIGYSNLSPLFYPCRLL